MSRVGLLTVFAMAACAPRAPGASGKAGHTSVAPADFPTVIHGVPVFPSDEVSRSLPVPKPPNSYGFARVQLSEECYKASGVAPRSDAVAQLADFYVAKMPKLGWSYLRSAHHFLAPRGNPYACGIQAPTERSRAKDVWSGQRENEHGFCPSLYVTIWSTRSGRRVYLDFSVEAALCLL
jgi:hypothetical protein